MFTIYRHEIREYIKSLFIWALCVGGVGVLCILLFSSLKESMEGMTESFASMGALSDAFGMSQLSMATLKGFYATEVGTIHGLGGAMFAAVISANMLSKEEDGHTSEFLFSLPIARGKVVMAKWSAVMSHILLFNLFCVSLYLVGIVVLGEDMDLQEFFLYHGMQVLMQLEIAGICFGMSAFQRKNKLGLALGAVLLFYAYDLMARVIPDLSDYKLFGPFSYANAADLFSSGEIYVEAAALGVVVLAACVSIAHVAYARKDLAV